MADALWAYQSSPKSATRFFSLLLSIWDGGCQPSRIDDTLLKGPTDVKERKGKGSLRSSGIDDTLLEDLEGLDERREEA